MNKFFKELAINMIVQVALVALICFLEPKLPISLVSCVVFYFILTHRKISHLKKEVQDVLWIMDRLIMNRMTRSEIDNLKITETGKKI